MSSQLIGQYDPAMTHYMNEVMALYRGVFRTETADDAGGRHLLRAELKLFWFPPFDRAIRCWCRYLAAWPFAGIAKLPAAAVRSA